MKIMVIGSLPPPLGGTTVSLQQLIDYLKYSGEDVTVIDTNVRDRGMLVALVYSILLIIKNINRIDVGSVHLSDRATIFSGWIFWLLFRLFRRPIIYRQFGGSFVEKYNTISIIKRAILRNTIFRSDAVLMQTKSMVHFMKDIGVRASWFPTSRKRPADKYVGTFAKGKSNVLRALFVGHVKVEKGIHLAIEAIKKFDNATLDIYGPLIDLDASNLNSDNIRYCGVLEPIDVPTTMSNYDLLVFPTTWIGEGYSGTLVEASMVGLPMIISKWQSLPEMFSDSEAIFVEPFSIDQITSCIAKIIADPEQLLERSEALMVRSLIFDADVVFKGFSELCRTVASVD